MRTLLGASRLVLRFLVSPLHADDILKQHTDQGQLNRQDRAGQGRREQGRWVIRLYIDREGGVNIDDCEMASRALEDLIDVELDIPHSYSLEVSSPGVHRPLRRPEDFARYRGATIRLKTRYPIDGRSNYKGVIEDVTGEAVAMVVDGMRFSIPFEALSKARLDEDLNAARREERTQ